MNKEKFYGTTTALITPFNKDLSVNYEGFKKNLEEQIIAKINGLLVLGTTGETPTLSKEEKIQLIEITVQKGQKANIPVIVGVGTNCTKTTVQNALKAQKLGADAILVVTPYYNKPNMEGVYLHFKSINEVVNIPIIIYNIKGRTAINIDTNTMKKLAKLSHIVGVKESSRNMHQIKEVLQIDNFFVLSGDDDLTCDVIQNGGKGVVSVVSNLLPKRVREMVDAGFNNDFEKLKKLHHELSPIFKGAFIDTNPSPIKAAMDEFGFSGGPLRLPLTSLSLEKLKELKDILKKYIL